MTALSKLLSGGLFSQDDDSAAQDYLNQVTGAYDGVTPPTLSPIDLEKEQWNGDITPEQINQGADIEAPVLAAHTANAAMVGPSALSDISTDPALRGQQMASLAGLKQLATNGGLNLQDKAALNEIQNQTAQADRGRRGAIMQNMAARGMGGSGAELLAQLQSNQAATDNASQQGMNIAGQAQARALQAMLQGGQLASQVQGQDFSQQAQAASAQDAINKFDAQNQTGMNQFNAQAQTAADQANANNQLQAGEYNSNKNLDAQKTNAGLNMQTKLYNSQGKQAVSNNNTGTANQQTLYNAALPQQNFQNQMAKAGATANSAAAGENYYGKQSDQDKQAWGNLIGGGAKILAGLAHGGMVPGKPLVPGDSPVNDVVPAQLSPGELVIPRSLAPTIAHILHSLMHGGAPEQPRVSSPMDLGAIMSSLGQARPVARSRETSPALAALAKLAK